MTPDYERAALAATETLIKYGINSAPIDPLPILKKTPGVILLSYQDLSEKISQDRECVLSMFGTGNRDAFTSVNMTENGPQYVVTYNQRLSQVLVQRSLARELGHILLGHDGTRPEEVRQQEAICFANYLLCPRPLIHMIQASGLRLTVEVLGSLTGCYDHCLSCIRKIPTIRIPIELNHIVRENFTPYFFNFFSYQHAVDHKDGSALADLGTYMDGYEE